MSLENINCPQFVDFFSVDAFDMNDGADYFFEKGVVGEDAKLNDMFQKSKDHKDNVDELISVLSNATNLNRKEPIDDTKKPAKTSQPNKNTDHSHSHQKPENKENKQSKQADIVGTSMPSVGSALDLVNSSSVIKENKLQQQQQQQRAKTPVRVNPAPATHKRTLSSSSTSSASTAAKPADKPLLPLYRGVRFIPKLAHKYSNNPNDSYLPGSSSASQTPSQTTTHDHDKATSKSATAQHKPLIVGQGEKKATLTRSTPGKSASFKAQNGQKKPNIIATLTSNIVKSKTTLTKTTSYSQEAEFHASEQAHTTHETPHEPIIHSQTNTQKMNKSSSSSTTTLKTSVSNLNGRKKSDNKPVGLLHTEMRALKRNEYDQHMKERERMANLIRQDMEQEKMRKQQEEIQKLRIKNTFKSNPIKHYKPVELKPSEKQLTSPRSPQFAINTSSDSSKTSIKQSTSTNSSIVVSTTTITQSIEISHDD